jgi:hypothetical protein
MARILAFAVACCLNFALHAAGGFLEAGTVYQSSNSVFGTGDTATVNGRYFAANAALGYEGKTWLAGVSAPFASRNASSEYYYADTNQKVSGSVAETGMGDPAVFGAKDIFGGNRYAPSLSITGSATIPVGKTALSLQTWQARPGLAFDFPVSYFYFALRTYAAIPFAAKAAVDGMYHSYPGAIFTAAVTLFRRIGTGIDLSYAGGDFVRYDSSLRVGGFISMSLPMENLSLYLGGQTEVVRSDRDFFMQMSVRYHSIKF